MVQALAARPNAIVFAGARDPARATDLNALAKAHSERVYVLKVISADRENNKAAIEEVKRVAGRLDIVIANAGINNSYEPALEVPMKEMVEHFEVRANFPLRCPLATRNSPESADQHQRASRSLSGGAPAAEAEQDAQVRDRFLSHWEHHHRGAVAGQCIPLRRVQGRRQLGHAQAAPRLPGLW